MINAGDTITIFHTISGDNGALFPRSVLEDLDGVPLAESPLAMTHVSNGKYSATFIMPNKKVVTSNVLIFTDALHTLKHPTELQGGEVFELDPVDISADFKADIKSTIAVGLGGIDIEVEDASISVEVNDEPITIEVDCNV